MKKVCIAMSAIIVAAGMGKRLKDFTNDRPKCMLEIDGISLFTRQTDLFLKNDIKNISVVVGYKKEWFTDKRFRYFVNNEYSKNNILHSLFYAEDAMNSGFLFSYCDIVYDGVIIKQMLNADADIAVAVDPDWHGYYEGRTEHPVGEAELVFSETGDTVSKIHKNADHENAVGEFLGIAYFSSQGAKILKETFHDLKDHYSERPDKPFHTAKSFINAYMTDIFQEIINRGHTIKIIKIEGRWAEIDTPRDLEVANNIWKNNK